MSDLREPRALPGAEQTVVTNLDEARWEHMLEEAMDELFSGERSGLDLLGGRFFVLKRDLPVAALAQAMVAERDAKDVGSKILASGEAGADCLAVNHPVLLPNAAGDRGAEAGLSQSRTKLAAEEEGERVLMEQKVWR